MAVVQRVGHRGARKGKSKKDLQQSLAAVSSSERFRLSKRELVNRGILARSFYLGAFCVIQTSLCYPVFCFIEYGKKVVKFLIYLEIDLTDRFYRVQSVWRLGSTDDLKEVEKSYELVVRGSTQKFV